MYATCVAEEPAFAWWITDVVRKLERILAKLKSMYWQRTHKFGLWIPKSVEQALIVDKENGNTLWWDAICKEMTNVRPAFEKWVKKESILPPGYQKIKRHFIFDVKMGKNFRRKARLVANGNETVVSWDSVMIVLLIALFNDFHLLSYDIQYAYPGEDIQYSRPWVWIEGRYNHDHS